MDEAIMRNIGITWDGLIRVAAVLIAMLLVPVVASAHGTGERRIPAADICGATQETACSVIESAHMLPATGHRIHCHLASIPPMESGPTLSFDDDSPVTVTLATPAVAVLNPGNRNASVFHIPIAALPRFILFGNFRS